MATVKLSVTLEEEDVAWLRGQAKRRRSSVSSILSASVAQARRERALDRVLKWLDARKPTDEELEEAKREWGLD